MLINELVTNALKYAFPEDREGEIRIVLRSVNEDELELTVSDNGAGIDPNDLERIFEPFVSIKSKYSSIGSGIGLYLSRSIIERLGGTIKALSEGKDKGSTFAIELPKVINEIL